MLTRTCTECGRAFEPSSGHKQCPSCRGRASRDQASRDLCPCGASKQKKSATCSGCRSEARTKTTCSLDGCDRPVLARGWCGTHYERWRASGTVGDAEIRRVQPKSGTCSAEGCDLPVKCAGYCGGHYWRVRTKGEPGGPIRAARPVECTVDGCTRKPCGQGLCRMHYERKRKGREIGAAEPQRRASGDGHVMASGYIVKSVKGRPWLEHRRIMEQLLGRELKDHETVHHVNGQRGDNRTDGPLRGFRSGNLELWSSRQPAGQRVADKVEFAVSLLREYAPELLTPSIRDPDSHRGEQDALYSRPSGHRRAIA